MADAGDEKPEVEPEILMGAEEESAESLDAQLVQIPMLLKEIAEENESNECWVGVVFWLCTAFFYIVVLSMQFRISESYEVTQSLKDSIADMSTPDGLDMDGVSDYASLWDWISNAAVPAIYDYTDYTDENYDAWDRNYLGQYNRVVGGLFLLQNRGVRFDSDTCETAHTSFFPVCYRDDESEAPYGVSCKEDTEWPEGSGEFPYKDGYCDSESFDKQRALADTMNGIPDADLICANLVRRSRSRPSPTSTHTTAPATCIPGCSKALADSRRLRSDRQSRAPPSAKAASYTVGRRGREAQGTSI